MILSTIPPLTLCLLEGTVARTEEENYFLLVPKKEQMHKRLMELFSIVSSASLPFGFSSLKNKNAINPKWKTSQISHRRNRIKDFTRIDLDLRRDNGTLITATFIVSKRLNH